MENFAMGYYKLCVWITRFIYVNLLWVLFSVMGLILFGFFPATTAMFAIMRKWVMGETDILIFHTFWQTYKEEFLKSNTLGLLLFGIGYLLYIDLQFMQAQDGMFYNVFSYALLGLFFLYFIMLLYVFPVFAHFEIKIPQYLKWALVIGITHPILTFLMGAAAVIIYNVVITTVPGISLLFLGSAIAYVLMWASFKTFYKFELDMVQPSEASLQSEN